MHFDWSTFALQTINFAVLVWLLHRFLTKPVLAMVDARRVAIDKQYADALAAQAASQQQRAAVDAERAGIAAERVAALKEAAAQAETAATARHKQAEAEATALLDDARKTLAQERDAALAEARHAALDLGADIARRLLADTPIVPRAQSWLQRITEHLATLPQAELAALIDHDAGLKVVTATALPAETAELWRTQLQHALGQKIAIAFDADPTLVEGADLHFTNAILHFSWQANLAAIGTDNAAHDSAH